MAVELRRAGLLLAVLAPFAPSSPAAAQGAAGIASTPEATAQAFLVSVRGIRWDEAAELMHADALERFGELVRAMVELDGTGEVRHYLTGEDPAGFSTLDAGQLFERAVGTMVDSLPGFMHALFDHHDGVIGHVAESVDTAHVVYRTTPRLSGAVSEVQVMQLVRTSHGWRVLWSDELEALDGALRGVMLGRSRRDGGSTSHSP